ncbi:MAG: hypothetical protein OXN89_15855 [Bryobacterales bacterium]|nr:hypothetical protein [Bryobacterales bacterium]
MRKAKEYIAEAYSDEAIEHVGLEEVDFDDTSITWNVTIGFFPTWQLQGSGGLGNVLTGRSATDWSNRSFKVVKIDARTGEVVSMKIRPVPNVSD